MEMNRVLLDALALVFFMQQIMALVLKRDGHGKYTLLPLLTQPLAILFIFIAPQMGADDATAFSRFELQVLAYQAVAAVLALLSRVEGQFGQIGFWLAAFMNIGSCLTFIYYAHVWSM